MSTTILSKTELAQIGTTASNGYPYIPDLKSWQEFRQFLVNKSKKRNNDHFDENLAAYTPGETLKLLDKKEIQDWFTSVKKFKVSNDYKAIILVPCAASKPWVDHKNVNKSKLYKAYNQIINEINSGDFPKVYFMTVSEPLGLVPQSKWKNFPKYDNPGLFKDDFLRTGLIKTDWDKTFLKSKHLLPFDDKAYLQCIEKLSGVIGHTLSKQNLPIISFVDAKEHTTHGHMLDMALEKFSDLQITRHHKKNKARSNPVDYIKETILNHLGLTKTTSKSLKI